MNQKLNEIALKKSSLTENSRIVLEKRYLIKDEKGNPLETPEEMFFRVAENIASVESSYGYDPDIWTEIFYDMMINLEFLPNSPTLMNAGRDLQQLSACFVLPVGDSMGEIFEAVKNTALIHKSGGGTGFSFSNLRPKNDNVKSTSGVSSGPVSFMRVFDVATETVKQGGTRRGANMGLLRCDHPDILEFIGIKEKDGMLSNFNISVAITDKFMSALKEDGEYELINPRTKKVVQMIKASEVFDRIIKLAWKNGEPGVIFIDRINKFNPTPHIGMIESTNPCGEQPLLGLESCVLGSINLSRMISEENGSVKINFIKLKTTILNAVRFLDNIIDMNQYPLPQIEKMTKGNRKIGLGIMGFSDMLISLGIRYNSDEAVTLAGNIMEFIQKTGREASVELAKERKSFPNFKGSIYDSGPELRNATITTIAPTGTLSMIAGCSSGIEPLFALVYEKNVLDKKLLDIHPDFLNVAKKEGFYSEELMKIVLKKGSIKDIDVIPKKIRDLFVTAHDIDPVSHINIQSAFQKYTDNAVSKTVNFSHSATFKDVDDVYRLAYEKGCKGITVYRDGSRKNQVLTAGSSEENGDHFISLKDYGKSVIAKDIKLPSVFENGPTHIIKREGKKFYLHFSYLPDDTEKKFPICIWIYTNHKYKEDELRICNHASRDLQKLALTVGIDKKFVKETLEKANQDYPHNRLGRMISLCLRHGIAREDILSTLMNVDGNNVSTLVTAVRKFLSKTLENGIELKKFICPECGRPLTVEEGCMKCTPCSYSVC